MEFLSKNMFLARTCVNGCPPLSELHGVVSYNRSATGGRYPVGTKGTYHCDVSLYSGSETRICQRSGVWSGSPALCSKSEKYEIWNIHEQGNLLVLHVQY